MAKTIFSFHINLMLYIIMTTSQNVKNDSIIYILLWTPHDEHPFKSIKSLETIFVDRNCSFQNCFLTDNRSYFSDILQYDVLLFCSLKLKFDTYEIPHNRSASQKYVFVSMEPGGLYPVDDKYLKGFFNITWTYKLTSDIILPYLVIRNQHDEVIGPKIQMHWMSVNDMNQTNDLVKEKLSKKKIAAAWIASNCIENRVEYVDLLAIELFKYEQKIDTFGRCGDSRCENLEIDCMNMLESDYFFYLAIENSLGEDYVTEKLLTALEHYAVPIVYGGANYSRFMPKGIYINAATKGFDEVARTMAHLINNRDAYYNYFRWHGYYSFHHTSEDGYAREMCELCSYLNTHKDDARIYEDLAEWWTTSPFSFKIPGLSWESASEVEEKKSDNSGFVETLTDALFERFS